MSGLKPLNYELRKMEGPNLFKLGTWLIKNKPNTHLGLSGRRRSRGGRHGFSSNPKILTNLSNWSSNQTQIVCMITNSWSPSRGDYKVCWILWFGDTLRLWWTIIIKILEWMLNLWVLLWLYLGLETNPSRKFDELLSKLGIW